MFFQLNIPLHFPELAILLAVLVLFNMSKKHIEKQKNIDLTWKITMHQSNEKLLSYVIALHRHQEFRTAMITVKYATNRLKNQ